MRKGEELYMFAIRVHEVGGPEQLRYEEIASPEPGPGQVRVAVAAVGLNYIDTYHRSGLYPMSMPFTPGLEIAGIIDALGPDVSGWQVGDRVATANAISGYAQQALIPVDKLVRVPEAVDLELAAAVMLQGMTAHYLVYSTFPLKAGDTCLVHAAAGGVGLLLCQIASQIGARVIGTTSNEEKAALARKAGASDIIFYNSEDVAPRVRELTNGRGVDVVYDSVGASTWEGSVNSLRPRGMLVSFGNASGPVPPVSPLVLSSKGSLFLTRPTLAHYTATNEELTWRAGDLFNWMAEGKLEVRVDRRYPLAEAEASHRALQGRETAGKVLLIP
jgi:NADPH:quinone reductase